MLKLPAAALSAGWRFAVGDAAADKLAKASVAVFMLNPTAERYSVAPPLFRLRIGKRSAVFEVRAHGSVEADRWDGKRYRAGRCTVGRWVKLASDAAPRGAAALAKLCKWYASQAADFVAKRDAYRWADDPSRDPNRCATRQHADRHSPAPAGSRGGKATNSRASHVALFGHAPASGNGCASHRASRLAELREALADMERKNQQGAVGPFTRGFEYAIQILRSEIARMETEGR